LILASAPAKAPPIVGHEVRLGAGIDALRLFDAATERAL
jgi:multiple sugar transport system ATP-binding protein